MWIFIYNYCQCILYRKISCLNVIFTPRRCCNIHEKQGSGRAGIFGDPSHYLKLDQKCRSTWCLSNSIQSWLRGSCSHWDFDSSLPSPPPKKKWFWSLGKFLEKCWICSWDWSLGKLPQKWWAQLQHWIFHGFRDHSHPQGLGDLGSISGYPKFCSSWKTAQELCPHPWELLWIPWDFPSLAFNSLSLQGEPLDSNCSSLGNSQIHKKYL